MGEDGYRAPVSPSRGFGRRVRVPYVFAGAEAEIERSLPLAVDEPVLLSGAMRLRGRGLPRPVLLRLTRSRLVLLAHYALRPDRAWELPRSAVRSVTGTRGGVRLTWLGEGGAEQSTRLTGWTGGAAPGAALRDADAVADLLRDWLADPGGLPAARRPPRHRR